MSNTTSIEEYAEMQETMVSAATIAQGEYPDRTLVVAMHPAIDELVRDILNVDKGGELGGIAGVTSTVVTEMVPGFAILVL